MMTVAGMPFEVSWTAEKLEELPRKRGIEPFEAISIFEDERTRLVAVTEPPYNGQERAIVLDKSGRLITIALTLHVPYPSSDQEIGIMACHTAWLSSGPERRLFNAG